jgi:hypothetical protein
MYSICVKPVTPKCWRTSRSQRTPLRTISFFTDTWFLAAFSVIEMILIFSSHFTIRNSLKSKFLDHPLVSFGVRYTVSFPMQNLSTISAVKLLCPTYQESSLHPHLWKWHISVYCTSAGCHYSQKPPSSCTKKVIISGWQSKRCKFWGLHGIDCKDCGHVGCDTAYSCRPIPIILRNTAPPFFPGYVFSTCDDKATYPLHGHYFPLARKGLSQPLSLGLMSTFLLICLPNQVSSITYAFQARRSRQYVPSKRRYPPARP